MVNFCCEDMFNNIAYIDQSNNVDLESDKFVFYSSKFNEYGIPIHDGENRKATSYILIQYCPWCGKRLPESRRDEWFDRLEHLGFESPLEDFEKIPVEFKSDEWYSR
ncbi:MAG: hypothetical protein E7562_03895 [Ruminococcaceae bacterium]|nr:hypothetical protein [Oscillospiraceae bacterium]